MAIKSFGSGGGGGAVGDPHMVAHSEVISGGATWHWPLDGDEVESVTGGSPVDISSGTLVFSESTPGAVQTMSCIKSTSPQTGAIGAAVQYHDAITIACWVKRIGGSGGNLSFAAPRTTGGGEALNFPWDLGFTYTDHKVRMQWQYDSKQLSELNATVAMELDVWEHWTGTRNAAGTIAKLYKNGVLDATSGTLNRGTGSTSQTAIQIMQSNGTEYNGRAFSIIVYKEEFDADDVLALYNSTSSTGEW
jgi:hypothetical protein